MITADQIICHMVGDYLLQSDWMATGKTNRWRPAAAHACVYSAGFLLFQPSVIAFIVIIGTHFLIDRYRLARYVVWAKNFLGPIVMTKVGPRSIVNPPWTECQSTGYPPDRPAWMVVWLMILGDNIIHILVNGLALRYL
jgi:hypothetical protein